MAAKPYLTALLALGVAGPAIYGVSHAQSESDLVGMLLVLINGTQNDVAALELRVEQVEAANAMLEQRIAVLEQAGNATAATAAPLHLSEKSP